MTELEKYIEAEAAKEAEEKTQESTTIGGVPLNAVKEAKDLVRKVDEEYRNMVF